LKPKIVVSVGKVNFPEDLAQTLKPLAAVVYAQGDYSTHLDQAAAVIVGCEQIDAAYLDEAPRLKIVARSGVGYDTVDVDACTKRRVYVTHTPDVLSAAVADLTWALILGIMRRIPEADKYARDEWAGKKREFPFGWDISGKTIGFLGLGRIGAEVAKRSQGFEAKLIYHDPVAKPDLEKKYALRPVGFDELLKASDILSIHIPLLPTTRHIIGERELNMMKPTSVIVNTSRGSVLDQDALTEALRSKKIAGAALDVFEEEPIPEGHPFLQMENVILTPHIASATWETRRMMAEICAENVKACLEGRRPRHLVPEQSDVSF